MYIFDSNPYCCIKDEVAICDMKNGRVVFTDFNGRETLVIPDQALGGPPYLVEPAIAFVTLPHQQGFVFN